ncbi:exported hypothetical protein [Burkholderiales bacterium 8X]|nr:exported hypothetical protein [Burkholderiales bacterium 8X]
MNKISIVTASIVVAASAFATSAFAEDYDSHNRTTFQGTLTRAEVHAGYLAAARANALPQSEGEARPAAAPAIAEARNRNAVRAEAVQAARDFRNAELM